MARRGFKPGMLGKRMWNFARMHIQRYGMEAEFESFEPLQAETPAWKATFDDAPSADELPSVPARPVRSTSEMPAVTQRPAAPVPPRPSTLEVRRQAAPSTPRPATPAVVPRTAAPEIRRQAASPSNPTPPAARPATPAPSSHVRRQPAASSPGEYKHPADLLRIMQAHEQKTEAQANEPAQPPPTPPTVQRAPITPRPKGLVQEITPKMASSSINDDTPEPWEQETIEEEESFEPLRKDQASVAAQPAAPIQEKPEDKPTLDEPTSPMTEIPEIPARARMEHIQRSPALSFAPVQEDESDFIPTPIEETEVMPLPRWEDEPVVEQANPEPEMEAEQSWGDDEPTLPSREDIPLLHPQPPRTHGDGDSTPPPATNVQREPEFSPRSSPFPAPPPTMFPSSGDMSLPTLDDDGDRETEQVDYNEGAASNLLNPFHRADLRRQEVNNVLETIRRAENPPPPAREPHTPKRAASQHSDHTPPVQRAAEAQREEEPIDEHTPPHLFDALMDAGMLKVEHDGKPQQISRKRTPSVRRKAAPPVEDAYEDYEAAVPEEGSVEADLLRLLDMPENTPVVGLKPPSPPTPPRPTTIAREEFIEDAEWRPHTRASSDNIPPEVQRAESAAAPSVAPSGPHAANAAQNTVAGGSESSEQEQEGPNIDKLAREVFRILRGRLRVEQERRTDK